MLSSVTLYYQIISVVMIWGSQLSETADEYDVQEQDPVDQQESEGKDYNHLGGLDQLDQLKKELRYKIKLLGPRQTLNFSLFPEDRSSREATHPNHPSFRFLAKLCWYFFLWTAVSSGYKKKCFHVNAILIIPNIIFIFIKPIAPTGAVVVLIHRTVQY